LSEDLTEESVSSLTAVAVLFACSLVAALVLFKILQSTAAIQKKEYQVGGAAAGFLLIYGALYLSYAHLQNGQLTTCQTTLAANEAKLAVDESELSIQGTVEPAIENATIVLTVKETNPDTEGRFLLKKKGVDLDKDSVALYVVTETKYFKKQIFKGDDISHLKIDIGGN
jgi:hypothetical protein